MSIASMRDEEQVLDAAERRPTDAAPTSARPPAIVSLYGLIGIGVAIACTWAFLALADELPEQGWMVRLDLAVTAWLQSHGTEPGETACVIISLFGGNLLAAGAVAYVTYLIRKRRWHRAWLFTFIVGGGSLLNVLLKSLFHRGRPEVAAEFHMVSWSFPSGHAMVSMVFYGLLGRWTSRDHPDHRPVIWTIAVAMIAAIGFARVYLGVHYVSDVVAGYIAGFVWLVTCVMGGRVVLRHEIRAAATAPPSPGSRVSA